MKTLQIIFIFLLHPDNISFGYSTINSWWKLCSIGLTVLIPLLIISILLIVLINRRKLKSIDKACKKRGLNTVWIIILVFTIVYFALATVLFIIDFLNGETEIFNAQMPIPLLLTYIIGIIIIPIILYSIPYFIISHFINNARIAIYGEKKIKGLTPLTMFEDLEAERDNYNNMKAAYKTYRKALADYNAARAKYVNENLNVETAAEQESASS